MSTHPELLSADRLLLQLWHNLCMDPCNPTLLLWFLHHQVLSNSAAGIVQHSSRADFDWVSTVSPTFAAF